MQRHLSIYFIFLNLLLQAVPGNATNYYSDPISGNMANDGSFNAPWAGLSSIFTANKTFAAGDTIFLRTGNHGYAVIKGDNTGDVVIMPQPGESPVLTRVRVSASANITATHWKLYRLTVQSEAEGNTVGPSYYLMEVYPYASHITIRECTLWSNPNTTGWSRDDWRNRCNNGLFMRARLEAHHVIENNMIRNVAFGLIVASSNTVVRGNTVKNFTNDGSRVLGSNILFEKNRILDLMKVMTVAENHDDIFQAFTATGPGQDTLKNDTILNNIFICVTDTTRSFRGHAQGIGCFDGVFLNWYVANNIVLTDHWHGIAFYGAVNCRIANNTVLDPYPYTPVDPYDQNATNIGPTWIRIDKKSNGPASSGNIVQNNLVANAVIFAAPGMGTGFNNIVVGAIGNYDAYFVDASDLALPEYFDLHLAEGSTAIDAGENVGAPATDYDGVPRPQGLKVDVGAFEYVTVTNTQTPGATDALVEVWPNPFQNRLHINMDTQVARGRFYLYNTTGQMVWQTAIDAPLISLPLAGLQTGLYFWKVQMQERSALLIRSGKVVKQ